MTISANGQWLRKLGLCTLAIATLVATGTLSQAGVLAPHRAIYEFSLVSATSAAGVTELKGRLVYELRGSKCEGFEQRMRFVTRTTNSEGKTAVSDRRSEFRENLSDDSFTFSMTNFVNRRRDEDVQGRAARNASGNTTVTLSRPRRKTITYDQSTLFPIGHLVKLLERAEAGDRILSAYLFDGAEKGEKVFSTTTAIGPKVSAAAATELPRVPGADALSNLQTWPVSMSYFTTEALQSDGLPTYEVAFLLFENGVSRRLKIDYGTFAMEGALTGLEMLEAKACP